MTEWNNRAVRHIPEEELHAYLDQALSRSQCVEIESHLAECYRCQSLRDDAAALRDRTTALLARIGPGSILPINYNGLRERFEVERRRRQRWAIRAGWAASLVAAIGLGWSVNRASHAEPVPPPIASAPAVNQSPGPVAPPTQVVAASHGVRSPDAGAAPTRRAPRPGRQVVALADPIASSLTAAAFQDDDNGPDLMVATFQAPTNGGDEASQEVFSVETQPPMADASLKGLWRSVPLDGAATQGQLPRVPGLPVVQVQVQAGESGGDVTAVDQQLEDGQMIRTLEGPASRVTSLLADQEVTAGTTSRAPTTAAPDPADKMTLTLRQGDRMLAVTGPSKVLGNLMSRVNVRRRY